MGRNSWYSKPERSLLLSRVPVQKPQPTVQMRPIDCNTLKDWAISFGVAVRQRTGRQETTIGRDMAHYLNLCTKDKCEISDVPVPSAFDEKSNT